MTLIFQDYDLCKVIVGSVCFPIYEQEISSRFVCFLGDFRLFFFCVCVGVGGGGWEREREGGGALTMDT